MVNTKCHSTNHPSNINDDSSTDSCEHGKRNQLKNHNVGSGALCRNGVEFCAVEVCGGSTSTEQSRDTKTEGPELTSLSLNVSGETEIAEEVPLILCSHLKKSIDPTKLRKILRTSQIPIGLTLEGTRNNTDAKCFLSDFYQRSKAQWLCLKCGKRVDEGPVEGTSIVDEVRANKIWCTKCHTEVPAFGSECKQFPKFVEFLKRERALVTIKSMGDQIKSVLGTMNATLSTPHLRVLQTPLASDPENVAIELAGGGGTAATIRPALNVDSLPRVRGLSNLGNTCFFNAVLQCLAQTPYLLDVLKESSEPGEQFQLPGGLLKLSNGTETNLPPIHDTLNSWGKLTASLAGTLESLQAGGGVVSPHALLSQLTTKWPQFGGGQQHDSHELLRHLLESVRTEDLRRYQAVILNFLGFNTKFDGKNCDEEMKQKIKFYGQQAADRILKPDQVFRGFLVSTLTCQDCYHSSSRHEYFLDISLPVNVEKPQPPIRRKTSPDQSPGPSKHQTKKEQKKERKTRRANAKNNRKNRGGGPLIDGNTLASVAPEDTVVDVSDLEMASGTRDSTANSSGASSSDSSNESDADVEDNCVDDVPKTAATVAAANEIDDIDDEVNGNVTTPTVAVVKSPVNPEKQDDKPENLNKDEENDCPEPALTFEARGISDSGASELVRQQSNQSLTKIVEKLSIDEAASVGRPAQTATRRTRTFSHVDWSTTIAPRYQCTDGECSIQSCLNNFTAPELMTGNNKVRCDACTERLNGKDGKSENTNATKQFLISSPPAVLILHLKRFQVGPRCIFRKLNKHVRFPLVLDLAPFCGSKVKRLPNINRHQKKLLYALYGIVEHSGSMHGGHYIAYVKVRAPLEPNSRRLQFIPQGSKAELDQTDEQRVRLEEALARDRAREMGLINADSDDSTSDSMAEKESAIIVDEMTTTAASSEEGAVGGVKCATASPPSDPDSVEPPPGKWYYVSDSYVKETTEELALSAEAYLLFYERIY